MRLIHLAIVATFETNADKKVYRYFSPLETTVKGIRMRLGWMLLRIGAFIMYGNKGESKYM